MRCSVSLPLESPAECSLTNELASACHCNLGARQHSFIDIPLDALKKCLKRYAVYSNIFGTGGANDSAYFHTMILQDEMRET